MSDIAFTRNVAGKRITEALSERLHFRCCAKRMFSAGWLDFTGRVRSNHCTTSRGNQHPEVTSLGLVPQLAIPATTPDPQ